MNLEVFANRARIGWLEIDPQSQEFVGFQYDEAWLAQKDAFPLCPLLPLGAQQPYPQPIVKAFFQNLLPEGQALESASILFQVSKANHPALLIELGTEMAGAISIGSRPAPHEGKPNRPLPEAELSARIRSRPHEDFFVWDQRIRLSIAGYQDKLAVLEENQQWFLVDDGHSASTHLIKPDPIRAPLAGMTTNEWACMVLAQAVRLPAAPVRFACIPEPILIIERFDRVKQPQGVFRRHCIDGCQALGFPVSRKYERSFGAGEHVAHIREGVSMPKLFDVIHRDSVLPAADKVQLLRWTIFQMLTGNIDAHGKNLSFFVQPNGLRLAPAYDLVCGLLYADQGVDPSLAMAIGDNFDARAVMAFDWAQMAHECAIKPRLLAKELQSMATNILRVWPPLKSSLKDQGGHPQTLEGMTDVFARQCENALRASPEIPKISTELF